MGSSFFVRATAWDKGGCIQNERSPVGAHDPEADKQDLT